MNKTSKGSIGIHCDCYLSNIADSLDNTFAKLQNCHCAQIFTHGPRSKNRCRWMLNEDLLKRVKQTAKEKNIYVHQTYCTSWKDDGLEHMQDQFDAADEIEAQGVVLHLGKLTPDEHIAVLKKLDLKGCKAILEMRALKPGQWSYQEPDEINALCESAVRAGLGPDQVGICLDTAHLNAGKITLTTREDAKSYIAKLKYPDYITLLHLNGNEYDANVRAGDKHCTPLGSKDYVFRNVAVGDSGASELTQWFVDRDCDVILEQDWTPELKTFHTSLTGTLTS